MGKVVRAKVTKAAIDRLVAGQTIRDVELKGFGARRQADAVSYFLLKRINGRLRWMTIGLHGSPWTAESARKEAHRLLGSIASGGDPATLKQERLENPSFTEASEQFMADHGAKLKAGSRVKYEILLRLYLRPAFGVRRLMDIKRADVLRFHSKLADKPATANYCVAILSKIMSWAEELGYRPEHSNPCFAIDKFRENKRQRYLSKDEFARLGLVLTKVAAESLESLYVVAAIRLLMFTGARVGEILTLKWSYVDLERKVLLLPDSKTGQKSIALNNASVELLTSLPRVKGNPFVIVGRYDRKYLVNIQKPWRRIRATAEIEDVRLHDLRHSFASAAAAAGGSLPMIGKLLGHKHPSTTARYVHLVEDATQALNQKTGENIAFAIDGKAPEQLAQDPALLSRLRDILLQAEQLIGDSREERPASGK
ncbi:site-specific integrase [Hyphomicrobium sp.]|uniref:site-specific integrase n=1 Tax=Hyphomicrobium sp. TaxID=82 RepID=UPI000FBD49D1|nr:site-specific integrase [Hyphomicrobium sp.]RUO98604.1 MAG: DUF4102 domain-containing protein [Hyphomicrobium sp.]